MTTLADPRISAWGLNALKRTSKQIENETWRAVCVSIVFGSLPLRKQAAIAGFSNPQTYQRRLASALASGLTRRLFLSFWDDIAGTPEKLHNLLDLSCLAAFHDELELLNPSTFVELDIYLNLPDTGDDQTCLTT